MDTAIEAKAINKSRISRKEKVEITRYRQQLLNDILDAKKQVDATSKNIDFVNEDMLLEHYILKLKAYELRYRYLLKKAKETGLEYNEYAEKIQSERYFR